MITLLQGDSRDVLATLAERSIQCCVTSPPYYGLRRYDVEGAQIGMEATPAEYVAALVEVFRGVRRVLRDDGTLWVNLGDSYAMDSKWGGASGAKNYTSAAGDMPRDRRSVGLADKNLIGIPWRVAFALQDDGWILRSDIIWSKPNPMPESVQDRPTRAHEYIFLFSKQPRYFYDAAAIAEPVSKGAAGSTFTNGKTGVNGMCRVGQGERVEDGTRNKRSVWHVSSRPFSGAHFAVFPEALIEPCILAGSAAQACEQCGAAWGRVVERDSIAERARGTEPSQSRAPGQPQQAGVYVAVRDLGFRPRCACPDNTGAARSVILDCFAGSGTTMRVAERYGRDSIGIDLGYQELQEQRTDGIQKEMQL